MSQHRQTRRGPGRGWSALALTATGMALVAGLVVPASPANAVGPAGTDLAAAVAALAPGATLRLPAGVYEVREPLALPAGSSLVGSGSGTVLRLSRQDWGAFAYGFAIAPDAGATGVTVSDLTIDGNRTLHTAGMPAGVGTNPPANAGGGIKLGTGWSVSRVRFTNLNYYPVWIRGVRGVKVANCTFDADGGSSGGKDNIGGGRSKGVTITANQFTASISGNAVDLVGSSDVNITDNVLAGSTAREHSLYLEGVRGARVAGNQVMHGSIAVTTDANYDNVTRATNPSGVVITGNTVTDAPASAITISYATGSSGMARGGGNKITGNTVRAPGLTGIAIIHCVPGATSKPDRISGNSIVDAFSRGTTSWGTGCGTVPATAIAVTAGSGTTVTGNEVTDSATNPAIRYAVYLGATRARADLVDPQISGNTAPATVTTVGWES